ncbi:MAG: nitroreductase family protein [Chloroflexi bacterium]|nr:nitroreductase family protein [Chloroflexota bacterium]
MDAMEAILTRRSIRKYTAQPVPDEVIKELLQAAMAAPSARNQQDWYFVVVRNRKTLDELGKAHPYAPVKGAPLAILVCGDLQREVSKGFWVQDCAAATQNLLLAAHAKGLGAVWCGCYPREERVSALRQVLGLPEHLVPLALVVIGYPAERKSREDRYDPAKVRVID